MNILVVGSGGREHALTWRLGRSGHRVFCAPGNPGMAAHGSCLPVSASDHDGLERAARQYGVDLVVVGPEAPLVAGLADRLRIAGIAVFGPGAAGARLEGSKIFAKQFFARHGIRSGAFYPCRDMAAAKEAIEALTASGKGVVIKADGLAAGKGVVVCDSAEEGMLAARTMLEDQRFGAAGAEIVVEERLRGRELSVMAVTDGKRCEVMVQAEDHKALGDGDIGPNTGGMGAISPPSWEGEAMGSADRSKVQSTLIERVRDEVLMPTLRGLAADGMPYRGVLYAGLMIDDAGAPWILEYNCRFGDPETQVIMARFRGDLAEWLAGAAAGALPAGTMGWDPRPAVCVVLASAGYPGTADTGHPIAGLDSDFGADVAVFHAGTRVEGAQVVNAGGRVLGVTALGEDVGAARSRAYASAGKISFPGMQFRRDIGARSSVKMAP